jgi:hypothetical protein
MWQQICGTKLCFSFSSVTGKVDQVDWSPLAICVRRGCHMGHQQGKTFAQASVPPEYSRGCMETGAGRDLTKQLHN